VDGMCIKITTDIIKSTAYQITIEDDKKGEWWQEVFSGKEAASAFLKGLEAAFFFSGIADSVDIPSLPNLDI
jgi:hypothetical protein